MKTLSATVSVLVLVGGCAALSQAPARPAAFARKPTVERTTTGARITFASDAECDATVTILNKKGDIVRRLASGMLGKNAPAPFQKGSLEQTLEWDGKDDAGKPVPPAGCSVRVSLGLRCEFDRTIEWEPPSVPRRGIVGLAVGPDGTLYLLQGACFVANCGAPDLVAFSREGKYLRTLVPPSAADVVGRPGVRVERSSLTDELVPQSIYPNLVPGLQNMRRQVMLVRNSRLLIATFRNVATGRGAANRRVVMNLGLDGRFDGAPSERPFGPALPGFTTRSQALYLGATANGETLFLAGLQHDKKGLFHAVYRANWTDDEFVPFFGKPFEAGKDGMLLNDPRGLAVDPKGRLLICDYGNDRIAVVSTEGRLLESVPIPGPEQIVLHPKTGEVYVLSVLDKSKGSYVDVAPWDEYGKKRLVKFDGLGSWKEVAAIDLPERKRHMHDPGPILALDETTEPPVLWISCVGRAEPGDYLWKVEDRGTALLQTETPIPRFHWPFGAGTGALAADRAADVLYLGGRGVSGSRTVYRFDGRSGRIEEIPPIGRDITALRYARDELVRIEPDAKPLIPTDHGQISALALGPDGLLYVRLMGPWSGMKNWLRRYDRNGKLVPFADGDQLELTQPSHGYHPGGFTVAPNGDIYVIDLAPGQRHRTPTEHNVLNVYGPDGRLKRAGLIPWLTSAAWGPRIDAAGNLYLTDAVSPAAFRPTEKPNERQGNIMRGSLIKFRPDAPRQIFGKDAGPDAPHVLRERENVYPAARLEGAEWLHYGASPVPFGHCVCPAAQFDLDGFGRAFVPDAQNYCIRIIDPAGNLIGAIGGYANRDSQGPSSAVPMPRIPIRSPNAVAVTDDAVYIFDSPNFRVVRARLSADASESVPIP